VCGGERNETVISGQTENAYVIPQHSETLPKNHGRNNVLLQVSLPNQMYTMETSFIM
jgi:hypothetical protein